jgi:hypothetical protein
MPEPVMQDLAVDARRADLGHGLLVQRLLPNARQRMVGPFIFLDHAGPVTLLRATARQADVRPHPHIGLATVSYLLSGAVTHRDSLGVEQAIRPGEVNWMTAGRGISHSERFEDDTAFAAPGVELLQSWVALPDSEEETDPRFDNYPQHLLPEVQDDGLWMRVIAGSAFGLSSPVRTLSPLFYVHASLAAGARLTLPRGHRERAAYIAHGSVELDHVTHHAGQMIVFGGERDPVLQALTPATVMLLGGEPLGQRHIWWNFVSSRKERIEDAKADWVAGRIALPPADHDEFIPLPA